jgi:hypothetical protein
MQEGLIRSYRISSFIDVGHLFQWWMSMTLVFHVSDNASKYIGLSRVFGKHY